MPLPENLYEEEGQLVIHGLKYFTIVYVENIKQY